MDKNDFRTKKDSCKFSHKCIVKKIQIGSDLLYSHFAELLTITCIFLTINFYENLQEYFFVRNQFLTIEKNREYKRKII